MDINPFQKRMLDSFMEKMEPKGVTIEQSFLPSRKFSRSDIDPYIRRVYLAPHNPEERYYLFAPTFVVDLGEITLQDYLKDVLRDRKYQYPGIVGSHVYMDKEVFFTNSHPKLAFATQKYTRADGYVGTVEVINSPVIPVGKYTIEGVENITAPLVLISESSDKEQLKEFNIMTDSGTRPARVWV